MYSNTSLRIFTVSINNQNYFQVNLSYRRHWLLFQDLEPIIYNIRWWEGAVFISQVTNFDARALKNVYFIIWFANTDHSRNIMLLQLLRMNIENLRCENSFLRNFWRGGEKRELWASIKVNHSKSEGCRRLLTIKYDWMVASDGLSVMRNFMPLNSMRAGAGRISFCLMLIVVIKSKNSQKSSKTQTFHFYGPIHKSSRLFCCQIKSQLFFPQINNFSNFSNHSIKMLKIDE